MRYLFFLILMLAGPALASEAQLLQDCAKLELVACERLGAYYLSRSEWESAHQVGEALCGKEIDMGCTIAGSALLAQGKIKEAQVYLNNACDKFEPYSCRSLARLMKKAENGPLANLYFKRACLYGLKEICTEIPDTRKDLTGYALALLDKINLDCVDTESVTCTSNITRIRECAPPLTARDCQLLPGHLSIYFRAKLAQAEAKLSLMTLHEALKKQREESKGGPYSFDLSRLLKDHKQQEKKNYAIGFLKVCARKSGRSRRMHTHSLEMNPEAFRHYGSRIAANIQAYFEKSRSTACADPKHAYEAFAVGSLDPLNPTRLDVWKIDQEMRLEHVLEGHPLP
jgi:hypothetical protein